MLTKPCSILGMIESKKTEVGPRWSGTINTSNCIICITTDIRYYQGELCYVCEMKLALGQEKIPVAPRY